MFYHSLQTIVITINKLLDTHLYSNLGLSIHFNTSIMVPRIRGIPRAMAHPMVNKAVYLSSLSFGLMDMLNVLQ